MPGRLGCAPTNVRRSGREPYEGQGDGETRYQRARTLNAHPHLQRDPRHVERRLRHERECDEDLRTDARHMRRLDGGLVDDLGADVRDW